MLFDDLSLKARLWWDAVLETVSAWRSACRFRQTGRRSMELTALEERIFLSATPMGAIAPETADVLPPETGETAEASDTGENSLLDPLLAGLEVKTQSAEESGDSAETEQARELIIVDAEVEDADVLLQELQADGSRANQFEIVYLRDDRSGLDQLSEIFADRRELEAVHILSHGRDGAVKLGNDWLDSEQLTLHAEQIAEWGLAFASGGDVIFYGCNVAESANGREFLDQFADLTATDVAGSENLTGATALGGDWIWEYQAGELETEIAVSSSAQKSYQHVLATVTVDTTDDVLDGDTSSISSLFGDKGADGQISLREAVIAANNTSGDDRINLSAGTYVLTLTGSDDTALLGDLDINDTLQINGDDADNTILDGNGTHRLFEILSNGTELTLNDLTLRNGSDAMKGGAIEVNNAASFLVLNRVRITDSFAEDGAGIFNDGTITLTDVEISNNTATKEGGGLHNKGTANLNRVTLSGNAAEDGGGIHNDNTADDLNLTNVTLSGNSASGRGGGLHNQANTTIVNSTIAFNEAINGGGAALNTSNLSIRNSLVINNTSASNNDVQGNLDSHGFNLFGDGGSGFAGSDQTGVTGQLNPLTDNGGFAKTHALVPGSIAINGGNPQENSGTDGNGSVRDSIPDIGAFEVQTVLTPVNEFRVNTATTNQQITSGGNRGSNRAVDIDAAGNSVVVWSSLNQDGSGWGVYAQRLDAAGTPVGGEFRVNLVPTSDQQYAEVAVAPDGRFVVVWESNLQDGDGTGIYARVYGSDGLPVTTVLSVNATKLGNQSRPSVAMDATGNFVVVWEGEGSGDTTGIFAQRFDNTGATVGGEFRVNSNTSGSQRDVSVSMNASGQFAVVWDDGDGFHVQRFNADGTPNGGDINASSSANAGNGDIAIHQDGSFVAVWRDTVLGTQGVYFQRYDSAGNSIGIPFFSNTTTSGDQTDPSISMDAAGNFLVVWEGNGTGDSDGVFGRKYNANGSSIGSEFRINETTSGSQNRVSVAMRDLDNFIAVWSGEGPGDNNGVFARQFGTSSASTAPTDLAISNSSVTENTDSSTGLTIGTLTTTDADVGDTFTYNIQGGNDAAKFSIGGGSSDELILTDGLIDFERQSSYEVLVRVTDSFNNTYDELLTISVANVNESPTLTDATLMISETTPNGTTVGNLTATDPDAGETFTYLIISGNTGGAFALNSTTGELTVSPGAMLDFETQPTYTLTVEVTDAGNLTDTATVFVQLNDVNETPTANAGGPYTIAEGDSLTLDASASMDPDGDTLSYEWDLDSDGVFGESGEPTTESPIVTWSTLQAFGIDDDGIYTIGVRVNDGRGGIDTATTTLTVTNTAPTITATGNSTVSAGGLFTLNLSASDDGNDTITNWRVDWGDGVIEDFAGNLSSVTHTYTVAGLTHNIVVSATDEDGTFFENDIFLGTANVNPVYRFDGQTGAFETAIGNSTTLNEGTNVTIGPDGLLYVGGFNTDNVQRFDPATNSFVDTFISPGSGGLDVASGLAFGPDGNFYVGDFTNDRILRFDGTTGAFIDVFVATGGGGLDTPIGIQFGRDGNLWVASDNGILRFDGTTGAFVDQFIAAGSGGLSGAVSFNFGPDGNLYVTSFGTNSVIRYNGSTGALIDTFVTSGSGGLNSPAKVIFSPSGDLLVSSVLTNNILRYDGTTGAFLGEFVAASTNGLLGPRDFVFTPNLQVSVTNTAPTADAGGAYTIGEGGSLALDASGSMDPNGDTLTYEWDLDNDGVFGETGEPSTINPVITWSTLQSFGIDDNGTYTIGLRVNDGKGGTDTATAILTVTNANPVAANDAGTGFTTNEDTPFTTTNVLINDSDPAGTTDPLTVVSIDTSSTQGLVTSNGDGTFNYDANAQLESLLNGQSAIDTFTYTISDGDGGLSTAVVTITITGQNDPPVVTTTTSILNYNEGNGQVPIDPAIQVTDADNGNLSSAIVRIATGFIAGEDFLRFTDQAGITGTFNTLTGVLTLTGTAPVGSYQTALQSVRYENTSSSPSVNTRQVSFEVSDGTNTGTASRSLSVISINTAPTGIAISNATLAENTDTSGGVRVGTLSTTDADLIDVFTYSIQGGTDAGVFTIGGLLNDELILTDGLLDFERQSSYNVIVRVMDLGGNTFDQSFTISITDQNEAPTISSSTFSLAENATLGTLVGTVTASDPDSGDTLTYSITGGNLGGAFTINTTSGQIMVNNPAVLDFETNPVIPLTVQVQSSGGLTDSATVVVQLTNQNEPPTIVDQTFSTSENALTGSLVGRILATDPDPFDPFTFRILSGNNAGAFSLNATTGRLRVADSTSLDFETQPRHTLLVEVRDTSGVTSTATITVNLTDANDPPELSDANFTIAEHSATGAFIGRLVATDPDVGDTLQYRILAGNTDDAFGINRTTGVIRVANTDALNFEENPQFDLRVAALDAQGRVAVAMVRIDLLDVSEPPIAVDDVIFHEVFPIHIIDHEDLTSNDINPEGQKLMVVGFAGLGDSQIVDNGNQTFTLAHPEGFTNGVVTFTYTLRDESGRESTATVTVFVDINARNRQETILPEIEEPLPEEEFGEAPPRPPEIGRQAPPPVENTAEAAPNGPQPAVQFNVAPTTNQNSDDEAIFFFLPQVGGDDAVSVPAGEILNATPNLNSSQSDLRIFIPEYRERASSNSGETQRTTTTTTVTTVTTPSFRAVETQASILKEIGQGSEVWNDLDEMEQEIQTEVELQSMVVGAAVTVSSTLTVGYVLWLIRGGVLIGSLLAQMPAWRLIDPLPILEHMGRPEGDPEDAESLESIIDEQEK